MSKTATEWVQKNAVTTIIGTLLMAIIAFMGSDLNSRLHNVEIEQARSFSKIESISTLEKEITALHKEMHKIDAISVSLDGLKDNLYRLESRLEVLHSTKRYPGKTSLESTKESKE